MSRPGKRARNNASDMEGSTIVVPRTNEGNNNSGNNNNNNNQQGDGSSSLILMLAKSCTKHNDQHQKEGEIVPGSADGDEVAPTICRRALNTLSRIIPKVEKAYRASSNPKAVDIQHLCDFYLGVVQRIFCPFALELFDYGQNPADRKCVGKKFDRLFRHAVIVKLTHHLCLSCACHSHFTCHSIVGTCLVNNESQSVQNAMASTFGQYCDTTLGQTLQHGRASLGRVFRTQTTSFNLC